MPASVEMLAGNGEAKNDSTERILKRGSATQAAALPAEAKNDSTERILKQGFANASTTQDVTKLRTIPQREY